MPNISWHVELKYVIMWYVVIAHRVQKCCMHFFHIRNPKNVLRTETLHTESYASVPKKFAKQ